MVPLHPFTHRVQYPLTDFSVDKKICEIADNLEPRSYTSREFIHEMGKYLKNMEFYSRIG